jgi:ribonuclease HII
LLAARYPPYGWDHNAGYGTPEHRDAIVQCGLTPHHRRSFAPNRQLTLELPM